MGSDQVNSLITKEINLKKAPQTRLNSTFWSQKGGFKKYRTGDKFFNLKNNSGLRFDPVIWSGNSIWCKKYNLNFA